MDFFNHLGEVQLPLKTNGWIPKDDGLEKVTPALNMAICSLYVGSLKCRFPETNSSLASENRSRFPKGKEIILQPSIFRCSYVSFREK